MIGLLFAKRRYLTIDEREQRDEAWRGARIGCMALVAGSVTAICLWAGVNWLAGA